MNNEKKKKRARRGSGSIYLQPGSKNWWIAHCVNGSPVRESSNSEKKTDAQNLLKKRIGEVASGIFVSPKVQRVTVAQLFEAVVTDYGNNGQVLAPLDCAWKLHLEPFFGNMRAANVGTDQIASYIAKRKAGEEPAANATINRELALLRRAFTLGYKSKPRKVSSLLDLSEHMLTEDNARTGFLDEKQYRTLADKVTQPWLRALLGLGYTYGFRRSELLNMRVGQVDLLARTIRLNAGETKNREGRTVSLTEECYQHVSRMMVGKQPDDFLLTRANGEPIKNFRISWDALTKAVNMPGLLFHDMRRSAVRNMVRRGVTERVAMKISGHKTRSVFDRYDIVNESDLADAALKVEQGGKAELARASVIHSSCIEADTEGVEYGKENASKPS